ncbi:MAG: chemotaxis protein CheA [Burkholderiales bacterium]|nr:chemotaxis protein CheA [Burkholderiales bacterium]
MQYPASALGDPHAYRAIFFEETRDHLANVETILLGLQPERPCLDELNAIFRAVHSIKGSAAMLGCNDMAALAHLQESLLDILRKEERPLERGDVDAMLRAGDTVQAQALRHSGAIHEPPDSDLAETMLREQLARPLSGTDGPARGPVMRRFAVRLGPLEEPIAPAELEMMLGGLAEMGQVSGTEVDNSAGGRISFLVELEGTVLDLRSVLSLLVAPELIAIDKAGEPAAAHAGPQLLDEFFVDPDEFRLKREAVLREQVAQPAQVPAQIQVPAESTASAAVDASYIRVATEKIDLLVNLVGELVITEAMLTRSGRTDDGVATGTFSESNLADLSRHTRNLQEAVLAIRMLPISNVFSRFPRLVHELSARLGKQVELKFAGEATELDRALIEKISDPLTHLVRNAIDHGLETPQARLAAGKAETGTLRLSARQRGGSIVIDVSDDGRGLDRERILAQAARRGIAVAPDAPDAEVWQLIFEPGFSTAQEVTELSGRGVGMDVVRRNIKALGGTVELFSIQGEAMTVEVSVPLTLAIIEAMTVAVGGETYVLPLATVVESLSVEPGAIHRLPGQGDTLCVRGEYLPVVHLAKVFPPRTAAARPGAIAVIVEADNLHAALMVDDLVGQQQVVVKSLEANFRKVPGLAAATVMGDGSVALILDISHIVRMSGRH